MSVKIIRPVSLGNIDENSPFEKSLADKGLTRIPGSSVWIIPQIDTAGRIRTGIDEESAKIRNIIDDSVRKDEFEIKRTIRLKLQEKTGYNLTAETDATSGEPLSTFYKEIVDSGGYGLKDGDNVFNMNNAIDALNFYWLCETGIIAKSYEEYKSGKYPPGRIQFYVYEEDAEAKIKYSRARKQDDAFVKLATMTGPVRRKVAKLLGLGVADDAIDEVVYTNLREYLNMPAASLTKDPLDAFMKFSEMSPESLSVEYLIRRLLDKNIIRIYAGVVKQGETTLAKSIEEFKETLLDPTNEDLRGSLEEKLKQVIANVLI